MASFALDLSRKRLAPKAAVLMIAASALALTGCWTRLTTPKESFLYEIGGAAPVLHAPDYQKQLAEIEARLGPQLYRIVVGVRLIIEVYGHGIRETVNVRPDGVIDLPLIGDVKAEGRSIPELKEEISKSYQPFFQQKPQIIVNTERDGELDGTGVRAGDVSVINPRIEGGGGGGASVVNISGDERVSQILSSVNGLSTRSEWRQIAIIRRSRDQERSVIILCDMERLIRYGDVQQDVLVRNGDIVFIPIERNTLIQEVWATFALVAAIAQNANSITDYVERVERY